MPTMSASEFDRLRPTDLESRPVLDAIADALRDREQLIASSRRHEDGHPPWHVWTWGGAPSVLREMFGSAVGQLIVEVPSTHSMSFCMLMGRSVVEKHTFAGSVVALVDPPIL